MTMDGVTRPHPFARLGVDTGPEPADALPPQYPLSRAQRRAYVRQAKTYKLVFTEEDMAGLQVRAKSLPLGAFMDLIDLAGRFDEADASDLSAEDAKALRQLFEGFAEALVSWNLEAPVYDDDGTVVGSTPVPATVEGMYTQDMEFVMAVIKAWMDAVAGVSAPLAPGSPSGAQSLEASMPMAPQSTSPAS